MNVREQNARNTIIKMLKKRNYQINFSTETETEMETGMKPFITKKEDGEKVIVFFSKDLKVGVSQVREIIEIMKSSDDGLDHAILVIKGNVSSSAKKATINSNKFDIELFSEAELQFDVTEHELQPKFTVLTVVQKKELLSEYKITQQQLPRILNTDPISRYYGAKKGTIFKIERPSETAGKYNTYRIVI
jgi:DNA-directed RNA polymerase I, II, and III subunit RPABC1